MANALQEAAHLKPEIRLAQAISHFEADLLGDQKAGFRLAKERFRNTPPNDHSVLQLIAELDRNLSRNGKMGVRCLGTRFTNFVQAAQMFASLGDVLIGGSQNIIACGVWTLVRMSLLSIVNISSCVEKFSDLLMVIGRSAPRYQAMAVLYPQSKKLQSLLNEYFVLVVRLCHQAFKFAQKSAFSRITSMFDDFELKSFQSQFEVWSNAIKEEVNLLMAQRIEDADAERGRLRVRLGKASDLNKALQQRKVSLRVLKLCSRYDHQTTWKQIRKVGSTVLLEQSAEYQQWKDESSSSTLAYMGKLGSGKSVVLASMVADLHLHASSHETVVSYFFCRHDIVDSLLSRTILGSLALQLLRTLPDLLEASKILGDDTSPDLDSIITLLTKTLPSHFKAYFILDGVDEFVPQERTMLMESLRKLQESIKLLVCVSVRKTPNDRVELNLDMLSNVRTTSSPDHNPDVEAFIDTTLNTLTASNRLKVGNSALLKEIKNTLLDGHGGMFLWVALQLDSLCDMRTDAAIRKSLTKLPRDLPETFSRILDKLRHLAPEYQQTILEFVTVVSRPLTTKELGEALSVVSGDTTWRAENILNDVRSTLACCGSIVIIDEEESTVRFVHHSVRRFLLAQGDWPRIGRVDLKNASRHFADVMITYLSYGVFGTQLASKAIPNLWAGSAPSRIIESTVQGPPGIRKVVLRLLEPQRVIAHDISRELAKTKRDVPVELAEFPFYAYCKLYWLRHLPDFSEDEPNMRVLLLSLFGSGVIDPNSKNQFAQPFWLLMFRKRRGIMLKALIKKRLIDLDSSDTQQQILAFESIKQASSMMLSFLIDSGMNMDQRDSLGQTPLFEAVRLERLALINMLIDTGKATIDARDNRENTPLSIAIGQNRIEVVKMLLDRGARIGLLDVKSVLFSMTKLLLERGANPNCEIGSKQPSMAIAMHAERWDIVHLLIKMGYDTECVLETNLNVTALHRAASLGDCIPAQILIDNGAHVNAKTADGDTPLWIAVHILSGMTTRSYHPIVEQVELAQYIGNTLQLTSNVVLGDHQFAKNLVEFIEMLVIAGADLEATHDDGSTPLMRVVTLGAEFLTGLLVTMGANIRASSHESSTGLKFSVLTLAVESNNLRILGALLIRGSEIGELWTKDVNEALQHAVAAGAHGAAELLSSFLGESGNQTTQGTTDPLSL